ncbi:MAG: zinc ribbon domain-containing protein [Candidatus Omnitrophota bacterium]
MPLYEYECLDCGEKFTLLVRNSEEEKSIICQKCKSKNIKKLFSVFSAGREERQSSSSGPSCSCGGIC